MSQLDIFNAVKDTTLDESIPLGVLGASGRIRLSFSPLRTGIVEFDLSLLPGGVQVVTAEFSMSVIGSTESGITPKITRLTQLSWREDEANFFFWRTPQDHDVTAPSWITNGAVDDVDDRVAITGIHASVRNGRHTLGDVAGLAQDAISNRNGRLILFIDADPAQVGVVQYASREESEIEPDTDPWLTVIYETGGAKVVVASHHTPGAVKGDGGQVLGVAK